MIRKCDGTDPYLTKQVGTDTEGVAVYVPCDCERRFDDVKYSTLYPHNPVGGVHYGTAFGMSEHTIGERRR